MKQLINILNGIIEQQKHTNTQLRRNNKELKATIASLQERIKEEDSKKLNPFVEQNPFALTKDELAECAIGELGRKDFFALEIIRSNPGLLMNYGPEKTAKNIAEMANELASAIDNPES